MYEESSPELAARPKMIVCKPKQYILGGTKVEFPPTLKPYPSQLTCMAKAVTGARLGQNCLLESPTGSGKTMAMLCSLLAWQKQFKDEADDEYNEAEAKWEEKMQQEQKEYEMTEAAKVIVPPEPVIASPLKNAVINESPIKLAKNRMNILDSWSDEDENKIVICLKDTDDEDDDLADFKSPKKKQMRVSETGDGATIKTPLKNTKLHKEPATTPNPNAARPGRPQRKRIPKIFFATRTHKQIAQVVSELKRSPYRNVNMTILNSREHSCTRNLEYPFNSKTEMCKALLDKKNKLDENFEGNSGCFLKVNLARFSPDTLSSALDLSNKPWDIEDLVTSSKKNRLCPYFASRDLMMIADIVFCPYNYIVDPLIRQSMQLNLTDNVILFDEAHNIEDCFRESNSFKFTCSTLEEAVKSCELGKTISNKKHACSVLKESLQIFGGWMLSTAPKLRLDGPRARERTCVFNGGQFANEIEVAGFNKKVYTDFIHAAETLLAESSAKEDDGFTVVDVFKPSPPLITIVDGLKLIMGRIFSENLLNRNDYHVVLSENATKAYREGPSEGGWMGKGDAQASVELGLNFWCMNPAIGFSDLEEARSVIVTSGTLSPMSSFQSELGAKFPHSLSTDHVISPSQVWVGCVSVGPRGRSINGVYKNSVTIDYQDEVGMAILQICSVVPYGVLCFFPSYAAMDNVIKRWRQTGMWHKLTAMKEVIVEPRQMRDFADEMKRFDLAIREAEKDGTIGGVTGALMMAVCRGKVSEGIDFKDNHARAVITVSIPYPSVMDLNVKLKKQYNDRNQHRQLLPGNQWYEIQAFRAINQALGRCIRHKNDWGAIILLDDRFSPHTKCAQSISKWAAKNLKFYDHWPSMQNSLSDFVQKMSGENDSSAPGQ